MSDTLSVWKDTYRIRAYEVDPAGYASIQSLCNYLQESAGNHAHDLGVSVAQLLRNGLTWVLSRLRVEMDTYPGWQDDITVETWPSGVTGLLANREFLVSAGNGRPIARASSAWLVVDIERKKPVRVPPVIHDLRIPERDLPLGPPPPAREAPESYEEEHLFKVRYSDLDMNQHVNNVRYVEWAVESVPSEVMTAGRIVSLDIQYRHETLYGDTVRIETAEWPDADRQAFFHRITRAGDTREAARAITRWSTQPPTGSDHT